MDVPTIVLIHNAQLGLKGQEGKLFEIASGYYEVEYAFGNNRHRVLLPIADTVLIAADPEEDLGETIEVEEIGRG